jgi:hypothetical protein
LKLERVGGGGGARRSHIDVTVAVDWRRVVTARAVGGLEARVQCRECGCVDGCD